MRASSPKRSLAMRKYRIKWFLAIWVNCYKFAALLKYEYFHLNSLWQWIFADIHWIFADISASTLRVNWYIRKTNIHSHGRWTLQFECAPWPETRLFAFLPRPRHLRLAKTTAAITIASSTPTAPATTPATGLMPESWWLLLEPTAP